MTARIFKCHKVFDNFCFLFRLSMKTMTAENFDQYELELEDSDLGSWEAGDKLVIASTDYNFNQAEEVEVVSVDTNKVVVRGTKFMR